MLSRRGFHPAASAERSRVEREREREREAGPAQESVDVAHWCTDDMFFVVLQELLAATVQEE